MSTIPSREEVLLTDALAQPPAERNAFFAKVCGTDHALLGRLIALIAAHEGPESLMAPASASPLLRVLHSLGEGGRGSAPPREILHEEKPGDHIGHYKLLQKIGEGGCGVVWMVEQEEPAGGAWR